MRIDHLAIAARDLDTGVAWAEGRLGVTMVPGGRHPMFATHNRLLGLGPDCYLEVISPDPDAAAPQRPRWFGLDHAPVTPCLANWIVSSADLAAVPEVGPALSLSRGDLSWELTVPEDGSLPRDGGLPTLIRWPEGVHPAPGLPDSGLRLVALEVHHPQAEELAALVLPGMDDPRVSYHMAAQPALRARFDGPDGPIWIG